MTIDHTLDANLSHCIQHANSVGSTTYYNICSHTTTIVPWGSADWLSAVLLGGLVLCMAGVIAGLIKMLLTMDF